MDAPVEYDIIFAGGGATACVVAGRLAAADTTLRILIVENGGQKKDIPLHVQPAQYHQIMTDSDASCLTRHCTSTSGMSSRSQVITNGKCIGGGSSVNAMFYNRAAASDYDDWMRLGNPGWGAQDLIPFAKKAETYQEGVVDDTHGSAGPIKVSYGGYETQVGRDFLTAAAAYPRGRNFTEDFNDFSTCDVYGRIPKYIDSETGRRSDAAHFYVYNQQERNQNLHILDHARVNRVLFDDNKRAVGIEFQVGGQGGAMQTAYASRLVVVSAGAFCSPAILERSGIGAKERLQQHGIEVVSDLLGVGENYKDHPIAFVPYLVPTTQSTLNLNSVSESPHDVLEAQWLRHGSGLLATNGIDAGIKLRPNAEDLVQLTPTFTHRWETIFADVPDKAVAAVATIAAYFGTRPPPADGLYTTCYFATHPLSTGSSHIRSADPFAPLEITDCMLNEDEDAVVLRWAYKWSRELARRMDSYRGEYAPEHPKFPEGSDAACGAAEGPVDIRASEIQYSPADDAAIDLFHREIAVIGWHALGTCAMRPRDEGGVVDPHLNVYGVKNLKVADLSIAPLNVGANTYNTALIIGEKAASLIEEELGISGI
ncbi:GMC oxidoreductase-domain-containing protein [Mycena crocata]|nr:GMC oxidoreductase-domain-containing protein [Mycena crocata]